MQGTSYGHRLEGWLGSGSQVARKEEGPHPLPLLIELSRAPSNARPFTNSGAADTAAAVAAQSKLIAIAIVT